MAESSSQQTLNTGEAPAASLAEHVPEAVLHLRSAIQSGEPWQKALLQAIGLWSSPQEEFEGRHYTYLVQGEAFDWIVLAERLCSELDGIISPNEKEQLLFSGRLPDEITHEIFRDLLGTNKYRGYLNFWYGVVVEEALQLSAEEDVRKRHLARCYTDNEDLEEQAFVHLYGETRTALLEEFKSDSQVARRRALSLSDLKGFTYWLHKRRLKMWDPARVASDTKKGIRRLRALQQTAGEGPAPSNRGIQATRRY